MAHDSCVRVCRESRQQMLLAGVDQQGRGKGDANNWMTKHSDLLPGLPSRFPPGSLQVPSGFSATARGARNLLQHSEVPLPQWAGTYKVHRRVKTGPAATVSKHGPVGVPPLTWASSSRCDLARLPLSFPCTTLWPKPKPIHTTYPVTTLPPPCDHPTSAIFILTARREAFRASSTSRHRLPASS